MGPVDQMGRFNVAIAPPLLQGECIYPFDTCAQLIGPVLCVQSQTVAPAMSWRLLAVAMMLLAGAGVIRVRQRHARMGR